MAGMDFLFDLQRNCHDVVSLSGRLDRKNEKNIPASA
jgi:hypothetical protein